MNKIEHYHDVESLMKDYLTGYDLLNEETKHNIEHQCDWEDFVFLVIDNETVITTDGLNGDVIGEDTLSEFMRLTLAEAQKDEDEPEWEDDVNPFLPDYMSNDDRDYSPSDPWIAPGMKVSDFITGVSYF